MTLWLIVLVRVLANPLSNVFQKVLTRKAADPLFVICATHGLLSLACLPAFLLPLPPLGNEFWVNVSVSAALAVAGNALLVQALRLSDLSVLGPINAYKAVVSLVPAALLLGEIPGPAGMLGIVLIVAGSYFVVDKRIGQPRRNLFVRFFGDRGVRYRFAALILSATEAVFLKRAVLASSPLATFLFWAVLGFLMSAVAVAVVPGVKLTHELGVLRSGCRAYLWLALTTGLMQIATLFAFGELQVGYALALFQTSTLVTVVLGHKLFREGQFAERLTGAAVMAAGAAMIVVSR